jgi:hypothetical protein
MKVLMKKILLATSIAIGSLSALTIQIAHAEGNGVFTVTSGFDYSSGKYGSNDRTDITSVPVIGKYEIDQFTFKLTVPYVTITGPGNVSPGIGKFTNTTTATRTTESGLGDVVAGLTYNVNEGSATVPVIDVSGKVKFGTADQSKGLGTGKNDYSAQIDLYKSYGNFTAMADLGYRVYGDTNQAPLDNVFYGSLGGNYKLAPQTSAGLMYDYRPAITANGSAVSEMTAFLNYKMTSNWKAQGYLVKGFSDGSPDYGLGALVGYVY